MILKAMQVHGGEAGRSGTHSLFVLCFIEHNQHFESGLERAWEPVLTLVKWER